MIKLPVNKLQTMAAASLLTLTLASTPARVSHGHDIVVPLATGFALGALAYSGHSHYRQHHYYRYQRHSYRYSRPHQYGHGNYGHQPRRSYSQGGYRHQPRYSSSQGAYHGSRRKH